MKSRRWYLAFFVIVLSWVFTDSVTGEDRLIGGSDGPVVRPEVVNPCDSQGPCKCEVPCTDNDGSSCFPRNPLLELTPLGGHTNHGWSPEGVSCGIKLCFSQLICDCGPNVLMGTACDAP
jgi:hypothetical protein